MKVLRARDRVIKSHDACTSGTSRVLTLASLQQFKMKAVVSATSDSEVGSTIKILNAQRIAPTEIHCQLSQVNDHTRPDSTVNTSPAGVRLGGVQSSSTRMPGPRAQLFPSFHATQEIPVSVFRMTERQR